jgi:hypothetical protein
VLRERNKSVTRVLQEVAGNLPFRNTRYQANFCCWRQRRSPIPSSVSRFSRISRVSRVNRVGKVSRVSRVRRVRKVSRVSRVSRIRRISRVSRVSTISRNRNVVTMVR